MPIGVISDTHGNESAMKSAAVFFSSVHHADTVFHLGDSCSDGTAFLQDGGFAGSVVPGIYCPEYTDPGIDNVLIKKIFNRNICLLHDLNDYKNLRMSSDIVLYGHTHRPDCRKEGDTWFINPGHLKGELSKGYGPSYGIMGEDDGVVYFEWYHPGETPRLCRRELLIF